MKTLKSEILKDIIANDLVFVSNKEDQSDWILEKNGKKIPIFFQTHKLLGYPNLMKKIIKYARDVIVENAIDFDKVVGATYGGDTICYVAWI